ncbi:nitroreductase family protein [Salinisphaera sp. P385]|uniref:Nitroreductase family protein n=1 Tax=Spectribacter acetivorans TaxID=3075603 RepID=A0ABU3B6D4_9GAMM|nr:nitroreductase family protein [Salinisphaera sp. P385]MDT0617630.1 nitroreductase family protein [Salinisphaera sp. P385]
MSDDDRIGPEPPPIEQSQLAALVRGRRTIARFLPVRPADEVVMRALEAARWVPNHKLTQPWRFHLLGRETATKIVDLNARRVAAARGEAAGEVKRQRWGAIPGWLAVTQVLDPDALRAREDYAACACAVHNLTLSLWCEGVASKWTTGEVTRDPEFHALLEIDPTVEEVIALLWYGYPDEAPKMRRRPVDELLSRKP